MAFKRLSTLERFMQYVQPCEVTGCWEWTSAKDPGGYGVFELDDKTCGAHRVSFELFKGPIPAGKLVMHTCDNRGCVRPSHLKPGTSLDNNRDMMAKGRYRLGVMPNRSGSANQNAKLTELDVRAIRSDTRPRRIIAAEYGITPGHVRHIKVRIAWGHVA